MYSLNYRALIISWRFLYPNFSPDCVDISGAIAKFGWDVDAEVHARPPQSKIKEIKR